MVKENVDSEEDDYIKTEDLAELMIEELNAPIVTKESDLEDKNILKRMRDHEESVWTDETEPSYKRQKLGEKIVETVRNNQSEILRSNN